MCLNLSIQTEYLHVETNIFVSAFNPSVSSFDNGLYNYVEIQLSSLDDKEANVSAFVNLCLAHATYTHGYEFLSFFDSLVSLFQLPREQQYKNHPILCKVCEKLVWMDDKHQLFTVQDGKT